jgi:hypothetical protein
MNEQLKAMHQANPFPWNPVIWPNGLVQVMDAQGKEVPMFTMTEYLTITTKEVNKEPA